MELDSGRIAEGDADLPEELHEGARGGDEGDDAVLGRVEACGGGAEGGALARADIAGDDGGQAVGDGVVEAVDEGRETGQGVEILDGDVLVEGLAGKAPGVGEGDHDEAPEPKSEPERGRERRSGGRRRRDDLGREIRGAADAGIGRQVEADEEALGDLVHEYLDAFGIALVVEEGNGLADEADGRFEAPAREGDGAVLGHLAADCDAEIVAEVLWRGPDESEAARGSGPGASGRWRNGRAYDSRRRAIGRGAR